MGVKTPKCPINRKGIATHRNAYSALCIDKIRRLVEISTGSMELRVSQLHKKCDSIRKSADHELLGASHLSSCLSSVIK
jgi:hypothetical protein